MSVYSTLWNQHQDMKFEFPESVERELAQQKDPKTVVRQVETEKSPVLEDLIEKLETPQTEEQIRARQRAIEQTTSKLYKPQSPLTPEYRSRSGEIEERLKAIQKRFDSIKQKEEAKVAELQRQAWLKYHHLNKPTIQDFKRPLTSFFLLASATYISLQFAWYALEREQYIEQKQQQQDQLVDQLNLALENQQSVIDQFNTSSRKGWWKFW